MEHSSFLYFTQEDIISKMNIDPRIKDTFKNVFIKIQNYLNKKGYIAEINYFDLLYKRDAGL